MLERESSPCIGPLVIALLLTVLLCGCLAGDQGPARIEGRKFVATAAPLPAVAPAPSESSVTGPDSFSMDDAEQSPALHIPVDPQETLLQVVNTNLDADLMEEQIIVTRGKESQDAFIKVMVVDYDSIRNGYFVTWQGVTASTDIHSFTLLLKDVTGDHNLEIISLGYNNAGEQALNIYRKTQSPSGFGLYYISICSLTVAGTIEIRELDRSGAYELDQKDGQSFPVITHTRDMDSDNSMDLVRTTYYWKYQDNSYLPVHFEKVPGQVIQEQQLQDLFRADELAFEQFLAGPWYLAGPKDSSTIGEIILFEPAGRRITCYTGGIQEVYVWEDSRKTIFRGLYMRITNEAISSIRRQMSIAIQSLDVITVDMTDSEQWDGTYRKLTRDVQKSLLKTTSLAKISPTTLSGLYRNDSGFEMYFSAPFVTIQEDSRKHSGGYAIYSIGKDILEIRIIKQNGLVEETRTYTLEYSEEEDDLRIVRAIRITPSVIGVHGVEMSGSGAIRLEQIEILERVSSISTEQGKP